MRRAPALLRLFPSLLLIATFTGALTSCATVRRLWAPPADARISVFSVVGVPSGDHLVSMASRLEEERGVYQATPDLVAAEIKVWTRAEVSDSSLLGHFADHHLTAVATAGKGSYRPPAPFPADADARLLTAFGLEVPNLAAHAVPGKITIFDFYADWCQPCRKMEDDFVRVLGARKDVAIRKLNILQFASPLSRQWSVKTIPYVVLYDRSGKKLVELTGNYPDQLSVALGRATVAPKLAPPPPTATIDVTSVGPIGEP